MAVPCTAKHPPLVDRVMFNGFAKIAWALSIAWLILACVKRRGGLVNTILCWPIWQPLARVQYCLYLLHRSEHILHKLFFDCQGSYVLIREAFKAPDPPSPVTNNKTYFFLVVNKSKEIKKKI